MEIESLYGDLKPAVDSILADIFEEKRSRIGAEDPSRSEKKKKKRRRLQR